ncbi:hypothetical protein ABEB36_004044 [Hypothenemus hampei]|uniref:Protein TsetseEP domain-containing protein n=1 Tax=Hypothenemus hampei TaxID=57062 RepID=A0ABD1F202_HYPHA
MNFKIFLAAFAFVVTIQVSQQQPLQSGQVAPLIAKISKRILEYIQEYLHNAEHVIDNIEESIPDIESEIIEHVLDVANHISEDLIHMLEELKKNASEADLHTINCFELESLNTEEALQKVARHMGKCVASEVATLAAPFGKIIKSIEPYIDELQKGVNTLEHCAIDKTDTECLTEFAKDESDVLDIIHNVILNDVMDLTEAATLAIKNFMSCSMHLDDEIMSDIENILEDTTECINKHM